VSIFVLRFWVLRLAFYVQGGVFRALSGAGFSDAADGGHVDAIGASGADQ
jgi:hypothetical protein